MSFTNRKSIHGRQLAISSTGGIITATDSTGGGSTAYDAAAQMWGPSMHATVSSTVGSTFPNVGMVTLSSGSATALSFEFTAPVQGGYVELHIAASASELTIGSPTTDIVFQPATAGAGSTAFYSAVNLAGKTLVLRGQSTARWAVIGSTAGLTIG